MIGAYLAGIVPTWVLELLFALMMLQSAYFTITKHGDDIHCQTATRWRSG